MPEFPGLFDQPNIIPPFWFLLIFKGKGGFIKEKESTAMLYFVALSPLANSQHE